MSHRLLPLALLLSAGAAHAQSGQPFTVQETGKGYYRLDAAIQAANGGDATILVAPGSYKDCVVVSQGRVAIRARTPGTVIFDGGICEGKATLVLRGADAMIDGVIFENDRVPDGNGAGIRLEHGNLTVMNATFRNSEEGILTADDPNGVIRVDRSTFSGLGRCDRGLSCAHSLYVGHYGKLFVTRTRFERGLGGHYLKSRAAYNEATDNSFDDSQGRQSNYIIDYPSGTIGLVARNIMVQGRDKENHSGFVVIAAEERANPSAGLTITGNTATKAPGNAYDMTFVIDFSHEPLKISDNHLGPGIKPFELE
jgi:hypothetical protein